MYRYRIQAAKGKGHRIPDILTLGYPGDIRGDLETKIDLGINGKVKGRLGGVKICVSSRASSQAEPNRRQSQLRAISSGKK